MGDSAPQNDSATAPAAEPKWDAFLSHASEDTAWCEKLAERLRNEGVRVWFDAWQMKPGDHLGARIDDGLKSSRKVVAVWSPDYFADRKTWTLAEGYSQQHADMLARERPLIPLLLEDCRVKPTLRSLIHLDFRNDDDFDLRLRQLIEALDLPKREAAAEAERSFIEHELPRDERGRIAHFRGKRFEDEVAALYRVLGFDVKQDTQLSGIQIDLQISKREGGMTQQAIVECKDCRITAKERDQLLAQQSFAQTELPRHRWIAVSSQGFAADTRAALEEAGFDCTTYAELLHELVPLGNYVEGLISEYEAFVADPERGWGGRDLFIRPDIETDISYEKRPALTHFGKWLGESRGNLLVVLGDLGTGKTRLASFLAWQLARSFRDDPLRHPAPVLIPLREVRKEVSLESIVIKHFRDRGLADMSFTRFAHLVRLGKIVLFFDAFDEMADRIRWEITQANFQELRRAAEGAGKVILTCRTHYFKDRTEQLRLIGEGPSLNAAETALYKELRQQSNAEVVYLQEFSEAQIVEYLRKTRGTTADADWRKIQSIWNLRDLAQRPLLLEMIVKSLPSMERGQHINAASLYTVYTNLWVERDFTKGRVVLDKATKLELMTELAWWMWKEAKLSFSTADLVSFIGRLHTAKALDFHEEEIEDIVREVQAASFLRREREGGSFAFMHRSFGEFFLARKLAAALAPRSSRGDKAQTPAGESESLLTSAATALDFRRLDRKVVYFLTLLDEADALRAGLQTLLTSGYRPNVSENALQILYWSGRVRCEMDEQIHDLPRLQAVLAERLPADVKLAGAQLQEVVLEGATFTWIDLAGADLSKANLNHVSLKHGRFQRTNVTETRAESISCERVNFSEANLRGAIFAEARFTRCDFTDATLPADHFASAELHDCRGVATRVKRTRDDLLPVVQLGSPSQINVVAWSSVADLLAAAGEDGVIRLYRAADGRLLRTLEGHHSRVTCVAFNPRDQTLASGGNDHAVRLWELHSGKLLHTLTWHTETVRLVTFSPDGRNLTSSGADNKVGIWDTRTWEIKRAFTDQHYPSLVAFAPDSKTVATATGYGFLLWDVQTGNLQQTLPWQGDRASLLSFSPDGKIAASAIGNPRDLGRVTFWNLKTGDCQRTLGECGQVTSALISPDGKMFVTTSPRTPIKLWRLETVELLCSLNGHTDQIASVVFSSEGDTLASAGLDKTVRVWSIPNGKLLRSILGSDNAINSVAFEPTRCVLASASADKTVRLWEPQNGKLQRTFEGHQFPVLSVALDARGSMLASGSADETVKIWEPTTGTLLQTLEGHRGYVRSVAFHPDGDMIASGSADQMVKLWHPFSGELLRTFAGHRKPINSVAFDPTGCTLASGSADQTVKLWETSSGKVLHTLEGHKDSIWSVAFDPTGQTIATASNDGTAKLWEPFEGKLLRSLSNTGTKFAVWRIIRRVIS